MTTARQLKELGCHNFRAGVWKPRTKPGGFEGNGEKALPWLQLVKKETGMNVATEVATPEHVELALKYDVDILWIGARTSANPFAMQALADSLRGVDKPVLVKNPAPCIAASPATTRRFIAICRCGRFLLSCAAAIRSSPCSATPAISVDVVSSSRR